MGTASGTPVSGLFPASVLVEKDGKKMLVDCGEGIQHQFFRSKEGLRGLSVIFITHMHGDHVLGLPGFLMSLSLLNWEGRIRIYGPERIRDLVEFTLEATLSGTQILDKFDFYANNSEFTVGDLNVKPFRVEHRVEAYGLKIEEADKPGKFNEEAAKELGIPRGPLWGQLQRGKKVHINGIEFTPEQVLGPARPGVKFVYTGDASPSEEIIRQARGTDCLVHDAAFPKGDEIAAHEFGHSTWYDAVKEAKEAGVNQLILFNFGGKAVSQLAQIELEVKKEFQNSYLAKDLWDFYVKK